jgi:ketosteroid isomerase-like protein
MKKKTMVLLFFFIPGMFLVLASCVDQNRDWVTAKEEVLRAENDFMKKVVSDGLGEAFIFYADDQAVLVRNDRLIRGREEISAFYEHSALRNVRLTWKPEFIGVSECGDLAYTWGSYDFSAKDSSGNEMNRKGVFHTVWKRQEDGSWKYVYD